MAQYVTPKNSYQVFNRDTFIDKSFLTVSQADDRYINEADDDSFEKFIGSLQVTGNESVQNMAVNGALVVSNGAAIVGETSIGQPLSSSGAAGKSVSVFADSVRIGTDAANTPQTNSVSINAKNSLSIMTDASAGNTTMGNPLNSLKIAHQRVDIGSDVAVLGKASGSFAIVGATKTRIGYDPSSNIIPDNEIRIDGNVSINRYVDASASLAAGGTGAQVVFQPATSLCIANNWTNAYTGFQGMGTRIYNPTVLGQNGQETYAQFCISTPYHMSHSCGTQKYGGGSIFPTIVNKSYFINIPDLGNQMVAVATFEYSQWFLMGRVNTTADYTVYTTSAGNVSTNTSRNRYNQGLVQIVANHSALLNAITISYILISGSPSNPWQSQAFTYINSTGTTVTANYTPITAQMVSGSTTKIEVIIGMPAIVQASSLLGDTCLAYGSSLRLLNASDGYNSQANLFPTNVGRSAVGNTFLSIQ